MTSAPGLAVVIERSGSPTREVMSSNLSSGYWMYIFHNCYEIVLLLEKTFDELKESEKEPSFLLAINSFYLRS